MLHFGMAAAFASAPLPASPLPASPLPASPLPLSAQQDARSAPAPQTTTNSPSEATATVSPITAAAAIEQSRPGDEVELSLGTSIATGHFGSTSSSSLWSTAVGARVSLGGVRLTASIPYMRVRSNGVIFTGIDSTPIVVASGVGPKQTNDGWGDVTIGASYTLPHASDGIELEVAGRVKFPTASSESRLSSGKTDYSIGFQATKVVGKVAPFVSATYRMLGDTMAFDLRDGLAASAGASFVLDRRTVLLGSYHFSRAASRIIDNGHELFLGGSRELAANKLRLTGFGTIGLSSGAAAASGGLAVSFSL